MGQMETSVRRGCSSLGHLLGVLCAMSAFPSGVSHPGFGFLIHPVEPVFYILHQDPRTLPLMLGLTQF